MCETRLCPPACPTPPAVIVVDLPGHVVDDRGEVSGSVKTDRLETLVIGLHYPLDTAAVRVLRVAILQTKSFVKKKKNAQIILEMSSESTAAIVKQRIPTIQT